MHKKRSTLSVGIKYSMHDLIYDVINYSTSSFAIGKISVYDQIVIKSLKRRSDKHQTNIYMNFHIR